ncbi:hypothetical protein N9F36_09090, partial [Akkermansiaceae bacterium]|nr:hypothetical protein [Akkermansiaceae bacterium]
MVDKLPIHALKLSVRCQAFEKNGNIYTIGQLDGWLKGGCTPPIKNIGRKSIREAQDALSHIGINPIVAGGPSIEGISTGLGELNPEHHKILIESLHLGSRGHNLTKQGVRNLGHLIKWYLDGRRKFTNFGKRSVEHATRVIEALSSNLDPGGDPDWRGFTKKMNIAFIPSSDFEAIGENLLKELPAF